MGDPIQQTGIIHLGNLCDICRVDKKLHGVILIFLQMYSLLAVQSHILRTDATKVLLKLSPFGVR